MIQEKPLLATIGISSDPKKIRELISQKREAVIENEKERKLSLIPLNSISKFLNA